VFGSLTVCMVTINYTVQSFGHVLLIVGDISTSCTLFPHLIKSHCIYSEAIMAISFWTENLQCWCSHCGNVYCAALCCHLCLKFAQCNWCNVFVTWYRKYTTSYTLSVHFPKLKIVSLQHFLHYI